MVGELVHSIIIGKMDSSFRYSTVFIVMFRKIFLGISLLLFYGFVVIFKLLLTNYVSYFKAPKLFSQINFYHIKRVLQLHSDAAKQ